MSGSQNRLYRNGSTAAAESGPPSWNMTTAIFFFSGTGRYRTNLRGYGYFLPCFRRRTSSCKLAIRRATENKYRLNSSQIAMYAETRKFKSFISVLLRKCYQSLKIFALLEIEPPAAEAALNFTLRHG